MEKWGRLSQIPQGISVEEFSVGGLGITVRVEIIFSPWATKVTRSSSFLYLSHFLGGMSQMGKSLSSNFTGQSTNFSLTFFSVLRYRTKTARYKIHIKRWARCKWTRAGNINLCCCALSLKLWAKFWWTCDKNCVCSKCTFGSGVNDQQPELLLNYSLKLPLKSLVKILRDVR